MQLFVRTTIGVASAVFAIAATLVLTLAPAFAQPEPPPPAVLPPPELDRLVSRIALYPDPLLAQVLAAATYPEEIPDAARWADQHHYLTGQALANAITGDQLPFDPSVQALLPFPAVLDMMASDLNWTRQLGDHELLRSAGIHRPRAGLVHDTE